MKQKQNQSNDSCSPPQEPLVGNFNEDEMRELLGVMASAGAEHRSSSACSLDGETANGSASDFISTSNDPVTLDPDERKRKRSDRKRDREKQRRFDINKQFDELCGVLKKIDNESGEDSRLIVKSGNRVELIARTIHYLEGFKKQNKKLKQDNESLEKQLAEAKKAGEEAAASIKQGVFSNQSPRGNAVMMMMPMMISQDGRVSYGSGAQGVPMIHPQSFSCPSTFLNQSTGMSHTQQNWQPHLSHTGAEAPSRSNLPQQEHQNQEQSPSAHSHFAIHQNRSAHSSYQSFAASRDVSVSGQPSHGRNEGSGETRNTWVSSPIPLTPLAGPTIQPGTNDFALTATHEPPQVFVPRSTTDGNSNNMMTVEMLFNAGSSSFSSNTAGQSTEPREQNQEMGYTDLQRETQNAMAEHSRNDSRNESSSSMSSSEAKQPSSPDEAVNNLAHCA